MTTPSNALDAYAPAQIARLVEKVGEAKAQAPLLNLVVLGLLAGAFISFGGMFFTLVVTESQLGLGPARLLGGVAFSLGLILVVIGGAELFTGNNLIVMAWADRRITIAQLLRNWIVVLVANLIGALASAVAIHLSGALNLGNGSVAQTAAGIALAKVNLGYVQAFFSGILCNALVCLAVWLSYAAHRVSGKILAIIFPISAFVAIGFEHCIANMYLIAVGLLQGVDGVTLAGFVRNLVPVTLGNVVGGSCFVALVYWVIYLRPTSSSRTDPKAVIED